MRMSSSVAPTVGCLPCLGRALCDALVSTQPCAACLRVPVPGKACAWLQVAGTPDLLCPLGGGFLHWSPVPPSVATQHLYPLSGSHCPPLCPFPHPPLQTWHSLPPTGCPALQLRGSGSCFLGERV